MPYNRERADMRAALIDCDPQGVMGLYYPVGSVAEPDPEAAYQNLVQPVATKYGVLSWPQLPRRSKLEGMNAQPQHHPEFGVTADHDGVVTYDEEVFANAANAAGDGFSFDFHPDAAAGYHAVLSHGEELRSAALSRVVKTHIATPRCSSAAWPKEADAGTIESVQGVVYPALVQGHIAALQKAFPGVPIILSIDDPGSPSGAASLENMGRMGIERAPATLIGYHNCAGADVIPLMQSGSIDVFHFESPGHHGLFRGQPVALGEHVLGGGLFAVGAVPQEEATLTEFARGLGMRFDQQDVRGSDSYNPVADWVSKHIKGVAAAVVTNYRGFVQLVATETDHKEQDVARHCFLSTTCGLGSTKNKGIHDVVYDVLAEASDMIRNDPWKT